MRCKNSNQQVTLTCMLSPGVGISVLIITAVVGLQVLPETSLDLVCLVRVPQRVLGKVHLCPHIRKHTCTCTHSLVAFFFLQPSYWGSSGIVTFNTGTVSTLLSLPLKKGKCTVKPLHLFLVILISYQCIYVFIYSYSI